MIFPEFQFAKNVTIDQEKYILIVRSKNKKTKYVTRQIQFIASQYSRLVLEPWSAYLYTYIRNCPIFHKSTSKFIFCVLKL